MTHHNQKTLTFVLTTFLLIVSGDLFAKSTKKKKSSKKPTAEKVETVSINSESLEGIWLLTKKQLNGGRLMKGGKPQFKNKTINYSEAGGMLIYFSKDGKAFFDIVGITDGMFNDFHKYVKSAGYDYTIDGSNVKFVPVEKSSDEAVQKMETIKYAGMSIKGTTLSGKHDVSFFWPFGAPTISQSFRKLDLSKDADRDVILKDRVNFNSAIVEFVDGASASDTSSGSSTQTEEVPETENN